MIAIYQSQAQETVRSRHYVTLILTWILLLHPQLSKIGHAQDKQPITKERLVRALKEGARDIKQRPSVERYIELIKQLGVDFEITPIDEQHIRKAGRYLGTASLDKLIAAVRVNYLALSGSVERVEVTPHPDGGLQVFIRLSIRNVGPPLIPHTYSLHVKHATSRSIDFKVPATRLDKPITMTLSKGPEDIIIQPQDALESKTKQGIRRDMSVSGWLKFDLTILSNVPDSYLRRSGTQFIVSFADVDGRRYEVVYEIP